MGIAGIHGPLGPPLSPGPIRFAAGPLGPTTDWFWIVDPWGIDWYFRSLGVDIPDGAMDQAKPFMDMIDAMGQEMFNEIIDENGDGAASLQEIEMVR